MTTPIFDQAHPKIIEITFCFPVFAPPCKKSFHFINSFLRYSQLATLISDHAHPNIFRSTFNLCKFVSTCKKSGYFIELFWRCDLKQSCNLIGWEHFSLYLRNQNFSQIWDLCRNTVNNINFHYRSNSVKINDQIF